MNLDMSQLHYTFSASVYVSWTSCINPLGLWKDCSGEHCSGDGIFLTWWGFFLCVMLGWIGWNRERWDTSTRKYIQCSNTEFFLVRISPCSGKYEPGRFYLHVFKGYTNKGDFMYMFSKDRLSFPKKSFNFVIQNLQKKWKMPFSNARNIRVWTQSSFQPVFSKCFPWQTFALISFQNIV